MSLEADLRLNVLNTFKALQKALNDLEMSLNADHALPAWFQPPNHLTINSNTPLRQQAFTLIGQLEYLVDQKPREILVGAGLIAASNPTLHAIQNLNTCKENFKRAVIALKNAKISLQDGFLNEHFEALLKNHSEPTSLLTHKIGLQRLHLKQCYRRIPILMERPQKVSWTWANTRAITRITVKEAEQLLLKQRNVMNATAQLQRLQYLSPEERLAIVQDLAPHLRANIVLASANDGKIQRMMVKGPIPLFYLANDDKPLPHIRPPKEKQRKDHKRKLRSDIKIDPEPFLPAIRAHRYLEQDRS